MVRRLPAGAAWTGSSQSTNPNHPVIYRDAEDVYLPRLKRAFCAAAGVARPWLVYGANVYAQAPAAQIVNNWPSQWLDGPADRLGVHRAASGQRRRPIGFQQDWAVIRSRPDIVMGEEELAYTSGPPTGPRISTACSVWSTPRPRQPTARWQRCPPATSVTTSALPAQPHPADRPLKGAVAGPSRDSDRRGRCSLATRWVRGPTMWSARP